MPVKKADSAAVSTTNIMSTEAKKESSNQAQSLMSKDKFFEKLDEVAKKKKRKFEEKYRETLYFLYQRFNNSKNQREQPSAFFDGLSYTADYIANQQAANTYLRPKLNDQEVRVNTTLTEKKLEVLYNELLAMDLDHNIVAFDLNDLEIRGLGNDFGDLVRRTNEIEKDDDMYRHALWEFVSQRAVFIEETVEVERLINSAFEIRRARKRLISGLKVFLGDVSIPDYLIDEQPFIVKYDRMHWRSAKRIFEDSDYWDLVEASCSGVANAEEQYIGEAFTYRMSATDLSEGDVEVLKYESVPDNEVYYVVNGILMYEPGDKRALLSSNKNRMPRYSIRMFTTRPLGHFAYGKPPVASAKTLQALSNETIRLLIYKFQQSVMPPMGAKSGKVFGRDAFNPGSITQNVLKKDFDILIDHSGISNSDIQMFNLLEKEAEQTIGASDFRQGILPNAELSATAALEAQKNAAKMLGYLMLNYMRMKRDMTQMRIFTLADHYMLPKGRRVDSLSGMTMNVYRQFTVKKAKLDNGRIGTKVIQFADRDLSEEELMAVKDVEDQREAAGEPFRFRSINIKNLHEWFSHFYIEIVAREKRGSQFDKFALKDAIEQAAAIAQLTGKRINPETLTDEYEITWRRENMFLDNNQAQMGIEGADGNGKMQGDIGNMMKELDKLGGSDLNTGFEGGRTQQMPKSVSAQLDK